MIAVPAASGRICTEAVPSAFKVKVPGLTDAIVGAEDVSARHRKVDWADADMGLNVVHFHR